MGYPVTYYCPRCSAVHELQREGYLADKTVTPYPLEGWRYADPGDPFEEREDIDGVRIVCGDATLLLSGDELPAASDAPDEGCGEPFYLSFVRFENGKEVVPPRDGEEVTIGIGPGGPQGPSGPGPGAD